MKEVLVLIKKNLKLIFDSKWSLFQLIIPVLIILAFMKLLSNGSGNLNVGLVDRDNTASSKVITDSLKGISTVNVVNINEDKKKESLIQRDTFLIITIPNGFEEGLLVNKIKNIDITVGEDNNLSKMVRSILNIQIKNVSDLAIGASGDKDKYYQMLNGYKIGDLKINTQSLKDLAYGYQATQSSIGFLLYYLMIRAIMVSAIIIKERDNNTYSRIFTAPVSSLQYLLGNILANIILLSIQVLITLVSLQYILKLNTGVEMLPMFILMMLIVLVAVAFGILAIALFENSQTYNMVTNLILTGTAMFSGCFVPIKLLPEKVQNISFFTPQRWVLDGIEKMQNGNSFSALGLNMVILLAFAVAFFLIAAYKIKVSQKAMIALD
ncbi:ABC transporter permease [Clostridium polyendosporum]|uniref:ABC transporter permease n=1 Tax=Clostridium polyendosporum TaxID=69208 RepID=A0A919VGE0_9CLOT|nr:ABC transporter permease [Clostridium polyendosporum]GIM28531.1 ABC transporter permease [Clostridium polyendosporum]